MKFLDLTLGTPAENLAGDEALLDLCEEEALGILRFWESRQNFVVVGYGNSVAREVNVAACRARGVPILRRCSGGGTVVQGPGCLNYNLTLRISDDGPLTTVTGTNQFVMERNRAALEKLLGGEVSVQGHTDLAWQEVETRPSALNRPWLKFSGNAQRRRRRSLVFHGTILHGFDLSLIDDLLLVPSQQPGYRADRGHAEFVRNIPASAEQIRTALCAAWQATLPGPALTRERLEPLLRAHYQNDAWNFSR